MQSLTRTNRFTMFGTFSKLLKRVAAWKDSCCAFNYGICRSIGDILSMGATRLKPRENFLNTSKLCITLSYTRPQKRKHNVQPTNKCWSNITRDSPRALMLPRQQALSWVSANAIDRRWACVNLGFLLSRRNIYGERTVIATVICRKNGPCFGPSFEAHAWTTVPFFCWLRLYLSHRTQFNRKNVFLCTGCLPLLRSWLYSDVSNTATFKWLLLSVLSVSTYIITFKINVNGRN